MHINFPFPAYLMLLCGIAILFLSLGLVFASLNLMVLGMTLPCILHLTLTGFNIRMRVSDALEKDLNRIVESQVKVDAPKPYHSEIDL